MRRARADSNGRSLAPEAIGRGWQITRKRQAALVGGNEPESSFIEVRGLPAGVQEFIPVRDFAGVARAVERLRDEHEVCIGAAPRIRAEGTARAVARVWGLWADVDTTKGAELLRAFRPLPNVVVRSGSADHVHGYWSLRDPLNGTSAQRANRRLALALGADMGSTDPARVLRPVGGFNHKHGSPVPVVCVRLEFDVFTADEVVGKLPDSEHYAPPPGRVRAPEPAPPALESTGRLDGLVQTVASAPETNRNKALYWAACRVRDDGLDSEEARAQLLAAAESVGLCELEAERTIRSALDGRAVA